MAARQRREELAQQGLRECTKCKEIKDLESDFWNDSKGAHGKAGVCKGCQNQKGKVRYYQGDGLQGALDNGYKRAKREGRRAYRYSADRLVKHWKKQAIDPMVCFYTGVPLTLEPGQDNTRNLEHVQPLAKKGSKGHVLTNLVPCSAAYNRYKASQNALVSVIYRPDQFKPQTDHEDVTFVNALWGESSAEGEPVELTFCQTLKLFYSSNVIAKPVAEDEWGLYA